MSHRPVQRSDEELDCACLKKNALLKSWFECMIGEDSIEEMLDDLCLLLGYRVRSWGRRPFYGTYTAWWEVEGYLALEEGEYLCADVTSLRQNLLGMPVKQFDLVVELAYQALSMTAEVQCEHVFR